MLQGATVSRGVPRVLPTEMFYPMPNTYLSAPPPQAKINFPLGMLGRTQEGSSRAVPVSLGISVAKSPHPSVSELTLIDMQHTAGRGSPFLMPSRDAAPKPFHDTRQMAI